MYSRIELEWSQMGWSYAGDGHGLKELEYGVVKCMLHVFNKYSRDVVGAG